MKNQFVIEARLSTTRLPLVDIMSMEGLGKIVKRENSFLLFEYAENTYLYFKDYGGIAFLGFLEEEYQDILDKLVQDLGLELSDVSEKLLVNEGSSKEEEYGEINVDELTVEAAHIICLNVAQSAALFHYQSISDELLENTRKYTNELEQKGTVSLKRKKLMKYIGSTLNLKNKISENLYVFATPMLAYENEKINKIDTHLNEELEIKYRYNAIKEQLNIIQENLDLFKDMNMHQHSSNLEWIIIWLILFEVIHVIIDQIL